MTLRVREEGGRHVNSLSDIILGNILNCLKQPNWLYKREKEKWGAFGKMIAFHDSQTLKILATLSKAY